MNAGTIPVIAGLLIFAASILSLRLGVSVAIFETLLGLAAGNLGLHAAEWMLYIAGFGGIVLTFLAGADESLTMISITALRAMPLPIFVIPPFGFSWLLRK